MFNIGLQFFEICETIKYGILKCIQAIRFTIEECVRVGRNRFDTWGLLLALFPWINHVLS